MFDFLPIFYYTTIYFHVLLLIMLGLCVHLLSINLQNLKAINMTGVLGYLVLIWVILYMGTRPDSPQFGDSYFYAHSFRMEQLGLVSYKSKDFVFSNFLKFSAQTMTLQQFFLLIDVIYIVPCFLFAKKHFKNYWFYAFFMFIGSFSFWSYGVNGLRNGIATSIFILALTFYDRKLICYALMFLAFGFHSSVIIPVVGFVMATFYRNTRILLIGWLLLIPISLASGGFWEGLFSGFMDDGRTTYLGSANVDNQTVRGFRWDFIVYSAMGIFAGYYFILKQKFTEKFYVHLFNTFLTANGFWILVIRANYSNRIAYLSWFLMAPVIIYPLVKMKFWKNQNMILAATIAVYYMFTYFMLVIKG
ncbi:hypothetical protein DBR32_03725 [Taibaiella sp. KBW10]|uniref:EpsG family protein n=1 Tax=Taibaiella sp. KBW10 TaxID=2153357 RepID=UPI000F5B56F4|nr:EpsG family protein [Taibaiella sp. KBW10]RQO31925.1 hypothetical protein DBR32_03725 [Taibaiella sp. KBW10]